MKTHKEALYQSSQTTNKKRVSDNGVRVGATETLVPRQAKSRNGSKSRTEAIHALLDQLSELVKQPGAPDPLFALKFSRLEGAVRERELQELSLPIRNWNDLKLRVRQMRRAAKRGQFDSHLENAARNLHKYLVNIEPREEFEYWKARTMLYKLNDVFQISADIGKQAAEDGFKIDEEIQELKRNWRQNPNLRDRQSSEIYRRLIREKVLFCCCRGDELKRRGDNVAAEVLFEHLLNFTNEKLKTAEIPCFGTRAYLSYNLGTMLRILEDHKPAVRMYAQALNLYRERARSRDCHDQEDFYFTTRRIAMCIGLGFGWVSLTRGYLNHAENALTTARAMLARIPDSLVAHYIELLYGSIKRCRAGTNQKELTEAIISLEAAYRAFDRRKHERYRSHVARELALAFNLTQDFRRAHLYLKIFDDYAKREGDKTNEANAHVVRSRINRTEEKYHEALAESQAAVKIARECRDVLAQVDALIARGEAQLYIADCTQPKERNYINARADFEEAQTMLSQISRDKSDDDQPSNPKIAAVCEFRIAQCCAREGEQREAEIHFKNGEVMKKRVEHKWVHELAAEVRSNIDTLKANFVISATDPSKWNRDDIEQDLRMWLLQTAMLYTGGSMKKAAELIGLSTGSLYGWINNRGEKVRRVRTKNSHKRSRRSNGNSSPAT